ncbi:hypothetical protein Tco_0450032 [Tanacetum coccineum]
MPTETELTLEQTQQVSEFIHNEDGNLLESQQQNKLTVNPSTDSKACKMVVEGPDPAAHKIHNHMPYPTDQNIKDHTWESSTCRTQMSSSPQDGKLERWRKLCLIDELNGSKITMSNTIQEQAQSNEITSIRHFYASQEISNLPLHQVAQYLCHHTSYSLKFEKLLLALLPTHTSDSSELTRRRRMGLPILYCFYFAWVYMYTILVNNMTKKVHLLQPKFTLGELGIQLLLVGNYRFKDYKTY